MHDMLSHSRQITNDSEYPVLSLNGLITPALANDPLIQLASKMAEKVGQSGAL